MSLRVAARRDHMEALPASVIAHLRPRDCTADVEHGHPLRLVDLLMASRAW